MTADATEFDIIVIGMGPGGEHVAGSLAEQGLRVLGIDHGLVGGECPYWGCIPSKMMVRAADALAEARRVPRLSGHGHAPEPDWKLVAARIRDEATDGWDDRVAVERFTGRGGTFVRGTGRLAGRDDEGRPVVDVDGQTYVALRGVVVNTGTRAALPPVPGLDRTPYWTNHDLIEATELPQKVVVLGGGAIGCELGQVMARFGVDVTIVEVAPRLLSFEEPEAGALVQQVLEADGVTVHVGVGVAEVAPDGDLVALTLADDTVIWADRLVVAAGRRADPAAVGLDTLGVEAEARTAPVDERCRVVDRVWAVGDITGKGAFTHVSMYQAGIVIRDVLGQQGPPADYAALPRVTFTDPEVGAVGLTEDQARKRLPNVQVGLTPLGETTRGWIHKEGNEGFVKVVADAERGVVVGATTMGPSGGEVLGALAVAVHGQVPVERLRSMIYAYPTFHRGIEDALGRLA
jgi:pyruvate/2-oxoglutarate dehydrogenase complex dihydrolipoamide dehydrogenase (E3) component